MEGSVNIVNSSIVPTNVGSKSSTLFPSGQPTDHSDKTSGENSISNSSKCSILPANVNLENATTNKIKIGGGIFVGIAVVCIVAVILSVSVVVAPMKLKERLQSTDWERTESNNGIYYTLRLRFDDDSIEYSYDDGIFFGETTLAYLDYKVIDGNTIQVEGRNIDIEFSDGMMTMTPAITEYGNSESWFED